MRRRLLLFASLLLAAAAGLAACPGYLIDQDPAHALGDGGVLYDGQLPSDRDGSGPGPDDDGGGVPVANDAGFGRACNTDTRKIEVSPLDLLIVLDVSYSMDFDQKWTSVKSAMKSFVTNPDFAGLGVGLQFFPLRLQCSVEGYQSPAVQIGELGGPQDAIIVAALDQQQMSGGTPTVQVLEGTYAYVQGWLARPGNEKHRAAVVLATDGMPDNTCLAVTTGLPNSLENVLAVAGEAAAGTPPVKTFVIGVGRDLVQLNQIAQAGGTGAALLVDTSSDTDVAFLRALSQIRRDALGCEFEVPPNHQGAQGEIDPKKAQVVFTPDDGGPQVFFQNVGGIFGCGAAGGQGWYFDDPAEPKTLLLCDDTCTAVTQGEPGKLDVQFACHFTPT